jgi:hypothetical protein
MKKILFSALLLSLFTHPEFGFGQSKIATPLTADSLASGNYKDALSSFYQLAFNDLTGPTKSVSFASNPFAIMARAYPKYNTDTLYYKYRHLRDFNFNFNLNLDTAYQFKGLNIGAKYALLNYRDQKVSRAFIQANLNSKSYAFFDSLNQIFSKIISRNISKDTTKSESLYKSD